MYSDWIYRPHSVGGIVVKMHHTMHAGTLLIINIGRYFDNLTEYIPLIYRMHVDQV